MDEKPKRRWFRFRLSTVLVLTAIVALGMAYQPKLESGSVTPPGTTPGYGGFIGICSDFQQAGEARTAT
jgi:hypothetical protein